MSKLIAVNDYNPVEKDKVFLDTNVWLNLFPPGVGKPRTKMEKTGRLYKKLLESKAELYTSSIVISEFLNSYARIVFNYYKETEPGRFNDFKRDFRISEEYKTLISQLDEIINMQILEDCKRVDDRFTQLEQELISEEYDVNDLIIMNICNLNQLKLITADADFINIPEKKSDIIII